MSLMSDFETRANNIETGIRGVRSRVEQFGYSDDEAAESVSRVVAMFVTYLTACEEARHIQNDINASFSREVLDKLPDIDEPSWGSNIRPVPTSSLKKRLESLWGIRVAFTHGDGDLSLIRSLRNKQFAINAPLHLEGVAVHQNIMTLNEGIFHVAIRSVVQLREILP